MGIMAAMNEYFTYGCVSEKSITEEPMCPEYPSNIYTIYHYTNCEMCIDFPSKFSRGDRFDEIIVDTYNSQIICYIDGFCEGIYSFIDFVSLPPTTISTLQFHGVTA